MRGVADRGGAGTNGEEQEVGGHRDIEGQMPGESRRGGVEVEEGKSGGGGG